MMIQKHIGYTSWNDDFPADRMPEVKRIENPTNGGYVFTEANGVVAMEAEHYYAASDASEAKWTIIPDMGRTRSGVTLMPYTKGVEGASLTYRFRMPNGVKSPLKIHIVVKSTSTILTKADLLIVCNSIKERFKQSTSTTISMRKRKISIPSITQPWQEE